MRSPKAAACGAFALLAASPAYAACAFQVLPIPVTMTAMRPTVPVWIGGRERHFLIDSGSFTNAISLDLASSQNLLVNRQGHGGGVIGSQIIMGAQGQRVTVSIVNVPELQFLNTSFKNQAFAVSSELHSLDGLLGQPMLGHMDVEYDLKGGVIRLVKTNGCAGTDMVYWAKDGQPYSKLSMAWTDRDDRHTVGSIFINGQKMRATFDTGASSSFITESAAARAGVKVTDPGVISIGKASGLDGEFDAWVGTFSDVKIGDEAITNAPLEIGRSSARYFDVLLGADFFKAHHVYVSNSQGKIFFAYEGGPVFSASAPPPVVPPPPKLKAMEPTKFPFPKTAPAAGLSVPTLPLCRDGISVTCIRSQESLAAETTTPH